MPAPVFAYLLDGRGGVRHLSDEEAKAWDPEDGVLWMHLDYTRPRTRDWLQSGSGLDPIAVEALLADETRPRAHFLGEMLLLALRGVNLNPGSEPEDMVSIRVCVEESRIISTQRRRLQSVDELADSFRLGKGPRTPGDFLAELVDRLTERTEDTIDELEEVTERLEDEVDTAEVPALRSRIGDLRRQILMLRRYLAPQRDALGKLCTGDIALLTNRNRADLHETLDRLIRHLEDMDSLKDRAMVIQEQLSQRSAEMLNRRMYVLSLLTAFFLPLGFLTGLMGINVGGIPGAHSEGAFLEFLAILILIIVLQILFFRRKGWL
nr:zinc transporter ZntB [uncultured Holophaga sp.]